MTTIRTAVLAALMIASGATGTEEGPVHTGFWRGVGPTRNAPVLETFIDELAARSGKGIRSSIG